MALARISKGNASHHEVGAARSRGGEEEDHRERDRQAHRAEHVAGDRQQDGGQEWVPPIIARRPSVSMNRPRMSGPRKFPIATAPMANATLHPMSTARSFGFNRKMVENTPSAGPSHQLPLIASSTAPRTRVELSSSVAELTAEYSRRCPCR